jgi:hypothetical protein
MYLGRKYRIAFTVTFGFFLFALKGQDTLNSSKVEQRSYQLYENKKWADLETFGKTSIAAGFDYYYLRMRIGIAFYEEGKYIPAQKHFEAALKYNADDVVALEYLYYCYIYTARYEEARWISRCFPKPLARKLKTDTLSSVGYMIVEGGIKSSDSSNLYKNGVYFHAGLGHYVANRFSLFHAVTYFEQGTYQGHGSQFQYYLRANVPLKKNWLISPAFQYMGKTFTPNQDMMMPPPPPGPGFPKRPPLPQATGSTYITGSMAIRKSISHADITLGTTISGVAGATQYLHSISMAYSPFKKNLLLLGCNAYLHTENNYTNNYFAINPFIAVTPFKPVLISVSYLNNNGGMNIIESNGYIINNSPDLTTSRWGVLASVAVTKQLDIYGLYQYEEKLQSAEKFVYHYNLFVIGIKIKPK